MGIRSEFGKSWLSSCRYRYRLELWIAVVRLKVRVWTLNVGKPNAKAKALYIHGRKIRRWKERTFKKSASDANDCLHKSKSKEKDGSGSPCSVRSGLLLRGKAGKWEVERENGRKEEGVTCRMV